MLKSLLRKLPFDEETYRFLCYVEEKPIYTIRYSFGTIGRSFCTKCYNMMQIIKS